MTLNVSDSAFVHNSVKFAPIVAGLGGVLVLNMQHESFHRKYRLCFSCWGFVWWQSPTESLVL